MNFLILNLGLFTMAVHRDGFDVLPTHIIMQISYLWYYLSLNNYVWVHQFINLEGKLEHCCFLFVFISNTGVTLLISYYNMLVETKHFVGLISKSISKKLVVILSRLCFPLCIWVLNNGNIIPIVNLLICYSCYSLLQFIFNLLQLHLIIWSHWPWPFNCTILA